jgi:integrase
MPLSALAVRNAKPGPKPFKLADSAGLYLLVTPKGGKLWRYDYRFAGRRKTLAIGAVGDVDLAEARERHEEARRLLRDGKDPSIEKRAARVARAAEPTTEPTFREAGDAWMAARRTRWTSETSWARVKNRIEGDAYPAIGNLALREIEPRQVLDIARAVEKRGSIETARRLVNWIGEIFAFAIAEGKADRDPSRDILPALKSKPPVKHRAALRLEELPEFFERLARYDGDEQTRLALRIIVYTFVRTVELRDADWREFDLKAVEPVWRIPGERMKEGLEHIVPLAPQVVADLTRLKALTGGKGKVLPSSITATGVISENTLLFALYRMGYHGRATVHGFRGTASTILNESGRFDRDWIERQLAHVEENQVRRAYNAAQWLPQRRAMMVQYAQWLDEAAGA